MRSPTHSTFPEHEPTKITITFEITQMPRGLFLENPDTLSGPESYFMSTMFTLKTQILLVLKADL